MNKNQINGANKVSVFSPVNAKQNSETIVDEIKPFSPIGGSSKEPITLYNKNKVNFVAAP